MKHRPVVAQVESARRKRKISIRRPDGSAKIGGMTRPTFRDAYLVEADEAPVGFVRRERHVWTIYPLGVAQREAEVFATREEAGKRLVVLAEQLASRQRTPAR